MRMLMRGVVVGAVVVIVLSAWAVTGRAQSGGARGVGAAEGPTFSRDVAPIMFAKCASCHRPGEVAPMPLLSFKDARPWAGAIKQKVASRAMPPWHADRQYGSFTNDLSLSDREIDTLVRWVDGGAREGDPAALPRLPAFTDGWQIGKPDAVFEMAEEFRIPDSGTIDYQYFEVPTNFTQDMWMQAGEVRAGDRAHVHHVIVYMREPAPTPRPTVLSVRPVFAGGAPPPRPAPAPAAAPRPAAPRAAAAARGGDAMLVNWAVGEDAPVHPAGMAKRIPAGATLIFQVHYTTDGTPGVDRSKVGFIFSKTPPEREVRTGVIANAAFAIPPGAADHLVEAEATFAEDARVWSMHPHMHLRGKDMTYTAIYPDGRREIVLRVPRYDFGWQTDYQLAAPLVLPKGSKLLVSAHFDNSPANRANPDPKATVRWGDQTWEEMMIGFITYTADARPSTGGAP
jgi:hypothetical protein